MVKVIIWCCIIINNYILSTDASPDTFETPQPIKGPSSSRTVDTTYMFDGKQDNSKLKNIGKLIQYYFK